MKLTFRYISYLKVSLLASFSNYTIDFILQKVSTKYLNFSNFWKVWGQGCWSQIPVSGPACIEGVFNIIWLIIRYIVYILCFFVCLCAACACITCYKTLIILLFQFEKRCPCEKLDSLLVPNSLNTEILGLWKPENFGSRVIKRRKS